MNDSQWPMALSITFGLNHRAIIMPRFVKSVVKRFDHRDTHGATIAFADEREGERWICKCVVAERRVEDPAGGPQSRDKVTAGSTLPSMPLPPPNPSIPSRSLAPSCLAQMKFSATLHSNAIKARIASWYPAKADGEPSRAETRGSSSSLFSFSSRSAAEISASTPPSSISRNRIVTCSHRGTLRDRSTRDSSPTNAKRAG